MSIFTDATKLAICTVAGACAQDMEYEYASDAAVVAETVMDADRLSTFGYPEAHTEVKQLVNEHGYDKVLAEAATFVPTA